ncbi:hypothetical protein PPOP_3580, partial [Paenibacillus popilliae ATCC 14706]
MGGEITDEKEDDVKKIKSNPSYCYVNKLQLISYR